MSFAHPGLLWLLVAPAGLAVLLLWLARRYWRDLGQFVDSGLLVRIADVAALRRNWRRRAAFCWLGLFTVVLAVLGPRWGRQWREVSREGATVLFALDTSRSMLANDLAPTRLDRSKSAITELLARLRGDRVGLILFAGSSFLQIPPTSDYAAFAMALEATGVNSIPRGGTAIGQAIQTAVETFNRDASASRILFLISDGENHEGDPVALAKSAAEQGMVICAVGVGSATGELIPITDEQGGTSYLKDASGQVVKSSLDEGVLREIARATRGGYVRATNLSFGLEELYRQALAGIKKTRYSSKWQEQQVDRYQLPLLATFLFLLGELFVGRLGGVRIGVRKKGVTA